MIKSTVQFNDISQITSRFQELGPNLRGRAVKRALNRTFVAARKDAVQVIRASFRVKSGELKQAAFKINLSGESGQMELRANRIGLGYFNPQQRPDGVKVRIAQATASLIELNSKNLFQPALNARGRQRLTRRSESKLIKGAFLMSRSKMKYTSGMRQGENFGVFVKGKSGQINATVNSRGKSQATRVKKIRRLFTISTAEMAAASNVSTQINNTIVNEYSRIYEQELRGFVGAVKVGRLRNL